MIYDKQFLSQTSPPTRSPDKVATVIYLINVDWFFVSHFQHLARRAIADGHSAILASDLSTSRPELNRNGISLVDLPFRRGGLRPNGVAASVRVVEDLLSQVPQPVLHAFGLFGVLVGTLATRRLKNIRRVYTITGRGYAAVARSPGVQLLGLGASSFNRFAADGTNTRWMVENSADISRSGLRRAYQEDRLAVVGGAGVDPDVFIAEAMPSRPPLRLGFVARLVWSKGLDIAVRAVASARSRGCDVTLTVAGAPDISNPRCYTAAELAAFASIPGIQFVGQIRDVPAFWRDHHAMLFPSRGGEGLPKSLLEAASCGRPILVSRVPGCKGLAQVTNGWSVPADDVEAMANAIVAIASRADLEARGLFARSIIQQRFSEAHLWEIAKRLYFE